MGRSALLSRVAVLASITLGLVLATRLLMEPDLGYHLAYGIELLDHGTVVDHDPSLYTLPAAAAERPEPGPGSWYDGDGRYRFANANWLSQALLALVHRHLGGAIGLGLLRVAVVLGLLLLTLGTMGRLGVPAAALAPALLLVTLASSERFYLRPELFGFLILAGQLLLLAGDRTLEPEPDRRQPLGWPAAAGLVGLQAVAVNTHGFFLLGLGLTLAVLADRLGRLAWTGVRGVPSPSTHALPRSAARLSAVLAGQLAACLVNPWGWRLALLPAQTVLYLRAHGITRGVTPGIEPHPWALMSEAHGPFVSITDDQRPIAAYAVLLAVGAVGLAFALRRRRWDWLLLGAGMLGVSLAMRRNIAPASLVVVPVALAAILAGGAPDRPWPAAAARLGRGLGVAAPLAAIAGAAWIASSVVTQGYWDRPASPQRFGLGTSRLQLPVGAAEWIRVHHPEGRVWADFYSSSTVRFFSGGRNPINLVTNTWAYPPDVLRDADRISRGEQSFRVAAARFEPRLVVLRASVSGPAARELARDEAWQLVHLEGESLLFLRRDGADAALARAEGIRPETLDLERYAEALEASDPLPAEALSAGATGLLTLGWLDHGIGLLERSLRRREGGGRLGLAYLVDLERTGYAFAKRSESSCRAGRPLVPCESDLGRAEAILARVTAMAPGRAAARRALEAVRDNLGRLQQLKAEPAAP
jgi:hypothetical protein